MAALVEVKDICKIYNPGENEVRALDHVSVSIQEKEFVAIIGHSGSGKSTVAKLLLRFHDATKGAIRLDGVDLHDLSQDEIRGRIAYDGRYGEFTDEPYYKDGNLDNITVTKSSGITQNEQLALLRAAGVHSYIEKNVTTLNNTKNDYEYHVEVAKERGGEFRKINVEFVIMDAFQQ